MSTDKTLSDVMAANYMQADLTLRIWQATKSDRNIADELAAQKGADKQAVTVTKKLLEGNKELKECVSAYGRIRTWFYAKTLAMGNGMYVVPVNTAMKFLAEFDKLKREADAARDELLDVYDDAINSAAVSLGSMFDPNNYPSKNEVSSMFNALLDVRPVPAAVDYDRLAIPGKLAAGLKDLYSKRAESQAETAINDLKGRLLAELDRMATQFGKVAKGEKTRLYNTLLTNMQALVEMARGMGAIDSGELSSLADDIEKRLLVTDKLDDFRDNAPLARSVSTAAAEIAGKLTGAGEVNNEDDEIDALVHQVIDNPDEEETTDDSDNTAPQVTADFDVDAVYY